MKAVKVAPDGRGKGQAIDMTFDDWRARLEACLREMVPSPKSLGGLSQALFRKWYEERLEPRAAAKMALRQAMEA